MNSPKSNKRKIDVFYTTHIIYFSKNGCMLVNKINLKSNHIQLYPKKCQVSQNTENSNVNFTGRSGWVQRRITRNANFIGQLLFALGGIGAISFIASFFYNDFNNYVKAALAVFTPTALYFGDRIINLDNVATEKRLVKFLTGRK